MDGQPTDEMRKFHVRGTGDLFWIRVVRYCWSWKKGESLPKYSVGQKVSVDTSESPGPWAATMGPIVTGSITSIDSLVDEITVTLDVSFDGPSHVTVPAAKVNAI